MYKLDDKSILNKKIFSIGDILLIVFVVAIVSVGFVV